MTFNSEEKPREMQNNKQTFSRLWIQFNSCSFFQLKKITMAAVNQANISIVVFINALHCTSASPNFSVPYRFMITLAVSRWLFNDRHITADQILRFLLF